MQPSPTDERPGQLLGLHDDVQPEEYTLETEVTTIGRSKTCDIIVLRNLVSRLHAKIERNGPHYVLRDAGSANGTFVNSRQIYEPYLLKNDDLLGFGAPTPLLRFLDPDRTFVPARRLRYDERAMCFSLDQQPLSLTPIQFRLLLHLYQHAGDVCTRESCAQAIWGRDYDPGMDAAALDEAISKLRGKLRDIAASADLIKTRRGVGFGLEI
jgi:DNA-binding response OmpR family regulator